MNHSSRTEAPKLVDEFVATSEIVVPLVGQDRHEPALTVANDLARRWGVPVHMLHVRQSDDSVDNDRLEEIRAAFRGRFPATEVNSTLVSGNDVAKAAAEAIPASALIVMRSMQAAEPRVSSMAEEILRATGGPALMIGSNADYEDLSRPVVVALDGSSTAEAAVDGAVAFAASIGQRVQLVQVVDPSTSAHVGKLRAEGQRVAESGHLQSIAERLQAAGHQVGWEVVHETDVVRGLLSAVKHLGAGIVALGSHGNSGLVRSMLGSTAMGLVAASPYPVLVVSTGGRDDLEITA